MPNELLAYFLTPEMKRRQVILDSNLLVLLLTGLVDISLLKSFKRVKAYEPQDFRLLAWLVAQFASVATTSYVLAEVSNLAGELSSWRRQQWFQELAAFARNTTELNVSTAAVGAHELVIPFGVTDTALAILAQSHILVTAEYRLSGRLSETGSPVVNFNHLRPLWMSRT